MLTSYAQVLIAAFLLGFIAAAPIGPVNMVAIHRGVAGRWTHTLACGIGSSLLDAIWCCLALLGGRQIIAALEQPQLHDLICIGGAVVLIPLGALFLVRAVRRRTFTSATVRKRMERRPPLHLWTDVGTGFVLTLVNPAVVVYWAGAAPSWLGKAGGVLGPSAIYWGLLAVAAGLMTWFTLLTILVRFVPNRLGATFFRVVNAICGLALTGFGIFCAITVIADHC